VKPYKGGVRHDYKDAFVERPPRKRYWSWFALGLALPLVGVALLLVGEPDESTIFTETQAANGVAVPPSGAPPAARPAAVRDTLAPAVAPAAAGETGTGPTDSAEIVAELAGSAIPAPAPAEAAAPDAGALPVLSAAQLGPPVEAGFGRAIGGMAQKAGAVLDLVVKKGDSLERLFRRNHLSLSDLAAMVRLNDVAGYLKILKPGDAIRIAHDGERVLGLTRELDEIKLLTITREPDGYKAVEIERPVELRRTIGRGVIKSSLFDAATRAGVSDAVTMNMAGIFQWDIDFIQDVRVGDTFTVIYEERWRDGIKLGNGPILAAEFVNQGHTYRAARYTDSSGHSDYYTPDGRSVRKAFIRAPVDFTRISSNFDLHRRHPILNKIRAHRGVDYAAPTGTPVHAAGDGKVIFRGAQGGYGNVVILQHGGNITTLYGHLSKFGKYRVGSRVKQGDIIAYVGKSGLATGPHLHYEYRISGVHRNPRTVKLPPADPVPAQYRDDFETRTAELWRELDSLEPDTRFATAAN
jgi:murein DD-endopeptidase MepM/ murein hydrolase activator NlpD